MGLLELLGRLCGMWVQYCITIELAACTSASVLASVQEHCQTPIPTGRAWGGWQSAVFGHVWWVRPLRLQARIPTRVCYRFWINMRRVLLCNTSNLSSSLTL